MADNNLNEIEVPASELEYIQANNEIQSDIDEVDSISESISDSQERADTAKKISEALGNEAGAVSTEALIIARLELRNIQKRFGMRVSPIPSMESFDRYGQFRIAKEEADSIGKRVIDAIVKAWKWVIEKIKEIFKKLTGAFGNSEKTIKKETEEIVKKSEKIVDKAAIYKAIVGESQPVPASFGIENMKHGFKEVELITETMADVASQTADYLMKLLERIMNAVAKLELNYDASYKDDEVVAETKSVLEGLVAEVCDFRAPAVTKLLNLDSKLLSVENKNKRFKNYLYYTCHDLLPLSVGFVEGILADPKKAAEIQREHSEHSKKLNSSVTALINKMTGFDFQPPLAGGMLISKTEIPMAIQALQNQVLSAANWLTRFQTMCEEDYHYRVRAINKALS